MAYRILILIIIGLINSVSLSAQEKGIASYYSNRLHGRYMSDGTKYHRDSLTCAHRRYPLGTYLKVTNLKNDKTVIVKVTDRCAAGKRIIDLSYAAAKEIGLISVGLAMVRVEKVNPNQRIPFKDDEKIDLPELDYEITKDDDGITPAWVDEDNSSKKNTETTTKKTDKTQTTVKKH
ncbi:MAG: septal ring lytic transglycosylase RlpA family protein [Prevotellaceae bacterium]|nr:septal ring lytic transglycosylase RlpA family protein [Prevotellaceae bacterium]